MNNVITIGCDLHDRSMLLKIGVGTAKAKKRSFNNNVAGRNAMVKHLRKMSKENGNPDIHFAYEASSQGFSLYDQLTDAGFKCYVLAPTKIVRTPKQRKNKTDEKDAEQLQELLRGHVLAGNKLPCVWVPDLKTRDDREVVRARLDLGEKITAVKTQAISLLKRHRFSKPKEIAKNNWTRSHRQWLAGLVREGNVLPQGARITLGSLLRQLAFLERETETLDEEVERLSRHKRYVLPAKELVRKKGIGTLTAMVYLTEMGDLSRFRNRRQIGAYLGVVPSSKESGEQTDRKGHITRQGPPRVRKVLCQAVWSMLRCDPEVSRAYKRIVARNPKKKKIAVVAIMRRVAIRMWHIALEAQQRSGTFKKQTAA